MTPLNCTTREQVVRRC